MKRTPVLLVLLSLLLALSVMAFAAVPAPPAAASAPAPAFLATGTTMSCADFCARAYCVEGTTCGIDPKTGKCGCYPSAVFEPAPTSPAIDSSAR